MKDKLNSALDRFYDHSIIAVPVSIIVFYALWYLVGLLGTGYVMSYAIKLIFS